MVLSHAPKTAQYKGGKSLASMLQPTFYCIMAGGRNEEKAHFVGNSAHVSKSRCGGRWAKKLVWQGVPSPEQSIPYSPFSVGTTAPARIGLSGLTSPPAFATRSVRSPASPL